MERITDIYRELHDDGDYMFDCRIPFADAAVVEVDGTYGLFVDTEKLGTLAEENVAVAHEAGHILTRSTHKLSSPYEVIGQHEARADKWAIKRLIPKDELDEAVKDGCTEAWELAERFDVTEPFMRKAVRWYTCGSLAET